MKLKFDIALGEMMAFQRRALERNRQFRKSITIGKIMVPVFLFLLVFMSVDIYEEGVIHWDLLFAELIVVGIVTGIFYLFFRRLAVWSALRRIRKMMASPKNAVYFKPRTMELGEEGLSIEMAESSDRFKWSLILEYEELDTVFLLYISDIAAHLIPKRILSDEESSELRTLLKEHITPLTGKNK